VISFNADAEPPELQLAIKVVAQRSPLDYALFLALTENVIEKN
jgi:hypothetical protein